MQSILQAVPMSPNRVCHQGLDYRAVSESDLIALIPDQLAKRVAPKLGLGIYTAPMPIEPALISMIWHKRFSATPAHRWLRELVAELLLPLNEGQDSLPN